jgi:replicative DNA helicase
MFMDVGLSKLFLAAVKANLAGDSSDIISMAKHLKQDDNALLQVAIDCEPLGNTTANTKEIVRVIRDNFFLRKATRKLHEVYAEAIKSDPLIPYPIFEKLSAIVPSEQQINHIDQFQDELLAQCREKMFRDLENKRSIGIPMGIKKLDQHLGGGLAPGRIVTVAARPGGGKTSFCTNIALNLSLSGHHPIYFTLEMNSQEISEKIISTHSGIELEKIVNRNMSDEEIDIYCKSTEELFKTKLSIASKTGGVWENAVMLLRNAVRYQKVDCAVIDYIQQYRMSKRTTQREEIDTMMQQIKDLANELQIPIIVVSQLNREIEKRPDGAPKMSDLKESGTIEQASDAVIILSFENVKEELTREDKCVIQAHIVKNRWGISGKAVKLFTDFSKNRIWGET